MDETKKREIYQLLRQGQMVDDIVVIEDDKYTPFIEVEFQTSHLYMGLCVSGYMKGIYDYEEFNFKKNDICWILPNHVMRVDEVSEDYRVLSVFVNINYFHKLDSEARLPRHYLPFFITTITLSPQQFDLMLAGYRFLGLIAKNQHPMRDEMICKLCDILSMAGDEFIMQNTSVTKTTQKHNILLFERFYASIREHYRESREVAYYAQLMMLSPKYFATIIKQATGRSASDWINNYVMVQAKWILQHDHLKTVQQISNYLGFSEQASFSRFFKSHTGMTPTEFREKA